MMHRFAYLPDHYFTFYKRLVIITAALLTSVLFSGCATTGPGAETHAYQYQSLNRFVRLETREANSPDNDHPYDVSPETLHSWLSNLKASGNVKLVGEIEVFTEDELDEVVKHIATALSTARPDQDVVFQSSGSRGMFGKYSARSFTSGRMFAQGGQLNLILGVLHSSPDSDDIEYDHLIYPTGSRSARVESGWDLAQGVGVGQLNGERGDWVSFAITPSANVEPPAQQINIPAPVSSTGKMPENTDLDAAIDRRSQEIESKLRVLDELKSKNLISEEEYQAKRKVILDGI